MAHPTGSETRYPKRAAKHTKKNEIERYPNMYTLPSVCAGDSLSQQMGDYTVKGVSRPTPSPKQTKHTRNSSGAGLSIGNVLHG